MSADATRLFVLGVVRIFEPANGYQLRRELLSWEVDRWANVNPGSIYSMLATLAKQGFLDKHDLATEAGRPVAVYTTTETGRVEFERMLIDAIAIPPESGDSLALRAAMSFIPALRRQTVIDAVDARLASMAATAAEMDEKSAALTVSTAVPAHVLYELALEFTLIAAQREWLEQFAIDLRAGALTFAGEVGGTDDWKPADDDPGWRMVGERQSYVDQLAASGKSVPPHA